MGATPGLATSEPTGQTATQTRQEVQPASANDIPGKVLTTVSMPLKAKLNVLKRYLEKKAQGKISTVSYLDWITEIKEFITKEFVKIFGKNKGLEYVECLDAILIQNIKGN